MRRADVEHFSQKRTHPSDNAGNHGQRFRRRARISADVRSRLAHQRRWTDVLPVRWPRPAEGNFVSADEREHCASSDELVWARPRREISAMDQLIVDRIKEKRD